MKGFSLGLLRQQHVARVLDRLSDGALMFGGKASVLTRQDFAGIGHVTDHQLRSSERELRRDKTALRLWFGRAHAKRGSLKNLGAALSTPVSKKVAAENKGD